MAHLEALSGHYDVAIIGGGVVGCAVARRYALAGRRTLLIEKAADILSGASKGNSALLHTGFDAPADSLELWCMQAGYREFIEVKDRLNLPILHTGAMVIAWNAEEWEQIAPMAEKARANGVNDVRILDAAGVREREPELAPAKGALLVLGEHVIDPWSTPLAYAKQAAAAGAHYAFDTEVLGGESHGDGWTLRTSRGEIRAGLVVNCAGLYGDIVEQRLLGEATFEVKPRKGQFVVFDKPASRLISHIILPVPNERTKGVVVSRTIFGNVLVGPTAEEQDDRARAAVSDEQLALLIAQAGRLVPGLERMPVSAVYAGLRPATERKEYRVRFAPERRYLVLGGIRSTGLTAALGLAQHAWALTEDGAAAPGANTPGLAWPRMPNLAEHLPRDWSQPDHGEIVCHCEMVTRREVEAALTGPLPARDLGGLKRRTRVCMGRCQGFYCSAGVAQMSAGKFDQPMAIGKRT
ncbi:FAD-dependent oxidoreductase [Achromobacter aegrifaciens]